MKVLHIMAGWGLVALGAVHGEGRGVAELGDVPGTRRVTGGAVVPKESAMGVLVGMTSGAVEGHFFRLYTRVRDGQGVAPELEIHSGLLRTETREHNMVHGDRTVRNAQVLNVAIAA